MTLEPGAVAALDGLDTPAVAALVALAREGRGVVLGVVPATRAGVKRIARSPGPEFRGRLEASFRARYPTLVRQAVAKVGDHARAEDVVQQAFEKVWRAYCREPREILNMDAYVYTAVVNEIHDDLRRLMAARSAGSVDAVAHEAADMRSDPQSRVADTIAVTAALAALAPREREAVVLRGQYDLSVSETAAIMKLSEGAVRRYTTDATRKLRKVLAA